MSILETALTFKGKSTEPNNGVLSTYAPSDAIKARRSEIVEAFRLGDLTMKKPRREFSDLSIIDRMMVDSMSFNTYQPNNGEGYIGDEINSWKSRAMRPIVRNKCISIAAHATARLIFPKVFAYNDQSDEQEDAAQVMMDLMEWAGDQSNYAYTSLYRTIAAMYEPASIGYTEYAEVYRKVKRPNDSGGYDEETILDETLSGFQDTVVPCDELYIENPYQPDVQKQGWLIWRRVQSYSMMEAKYSVHYGDQFKFVKPGVQLLYNDANQSFYEVYDSNLRSYECEEIIYWNKNQDLKIIMVNGVMLTDDENPNPRQDKQYPFDKFGYELINTRFFYYKSLAFKMQQDANIINTLYPMIIDGTYLSLMPPMVATGGEIIGSDVVIPGAVTTLADSNSTLQAIRLSQDIKQGTDTLFQVEESINDSSQDPIQSGQADKGSQTAYEISKIEQNANTVLGLFIQMIASHVKQFGNLRKGDIIQYLTIADVSEIESDPKLLYKAFMMQNKDSNGAVKSRKITFDNSLPSEPMTKDEHLKMSYGVMEEEGGANSKTQLYKVNPELFRTLKYHVTISPDVMNPMSEDLERAYMLEEYDRAIANPLIDQESATRDFLLAAYPKSKRDPDKYISKNPQNAALNPAMGADGQPVAPAPAAATAPSAKLSTPSPIPAIK